MIKTFHDFCKFADIIRADDIERAISSQPPAEIGGVETPQNLFSVEWGVFAELCEPTDEADVFTRPLRLLLGISEEEAQNLPAVAVLSFAGWVRSELERLNNLLKAIKSEVSPEEEQAGAKNLSWGAFGVLDWYCLRMGLKNHDEAAKTPFARIYMAMKKDNEIASYKERLHKIITRKK